MEQELMHPPGSFSYYVSRLTKFLTDQGSDLYFEEQVTEIATHDRKISGVSTATGKDLHREKLYLWNGSTSRSTTHRLATLSWAV